MYRVAHSIVSPEFPPGHAPEASDAVLETNDLGSGGSDHHAISAVLAFPVGKMSKATTDIGMEPGSSVQALENAKGSDGCLIEPKQMYVYAETAWAIYKTNIVDPRVRLGVVDALRRGSEEP